MSGDDPPPESFDYGERLEDGQYENHPTQSGQKRQPVRRKYRHEKCGEITTMPKHIAESVAVDPDYYGKTFCAECEKYVPVEEVSWAMDGLDWKIPQEEIDRWERLFSDGDDDE